MNKSLILIVLSCLVAHISLAADIKVQNDKSNIIGRVNVLTDLISGGVNAICLDQDVLFCGNDHRVYALDASEPMLPKNLSYIELSGYVRQMVKQGDYLYVACRETGVWIINVADPKNMQLISRYDPVELATGVDVAGDVMFLAMRQNGVEIVDVTDKANPTHIRLEKTNESQSVFYYDGFLYSGEWRGHHVTTISVEDISDVKTCCTSDLNGYGDGVWAHGKYLYATTGLHATGNHEAKKGDGHGLEIFRISDKSKPEFVSRLDFAVTPKTYPDYWTPRPCNNGDYVVCADTHNGVYIVDTRKKSSPKVASQLSVLKEDGSTISVTTVAVGNGVIYVGMHSEVGVLAVECPSIKPVVRDKGKFPKNASYRYPYETSANSHFTSWKPLAGAPVRGVAATDSVLYVASAHGGLAILAMDKDGNVNQVGKGPMRYAGDVKVHGDKLIVAEGYDGFAVYQIGTELKELGRYNSFEREGEKSLCLWVFAPSENCVVASTRLHGYYYFDISELSEIKSLGRLGRGPGWDKYVADRADSKGWYPRLWHNSGPFWANLNDISKGETKDSGFRTTLFDGVCLYKDDQFITCSGGKMYVYSAQDIGKTRIGSGEGLYGAPAWDGSDKVGLTARIDRQISLVKMSEKNVPTLLWTEKCEGFPEIGTFWNGRFVVPCGHQGLLIEKKHQGYQREKDIVYRPGVQMCNLDVAFPDIKGENLPVVVWFHGGGLTKGKKSIPEELLNDSKIVVGVEYRLYPEVSVAQIIDDAALAVSWVFDHIADYGGSEQKIVLSGHSAGGYLVTMLALDKKYLEAYGKDADQIAAVVPYSGQMITHFTERASKGIDALTPVIDNFAPIAHLRADAPPMVIITGDREMELYGRYEENAYFVRMMKLHGHKAVTLYELQGFGHSMRQPGHCILNKYMERFK